MQTSYRGRCFIARHEAAVLVAYQDGKHLSIGYGHNSPDLKPGDTITFEEAWALLKTDLEARERIVSKWLKVPVEQHKFDACMSTYYQKGSAVRQVINLVNEGDEAEAMALLLTFNRNQGKFSDGLAERRNQERRLFRRADYGDEAKPVPMLKLWTGDPRTTPPTEVPFPPAD